MKKLFKSKSKTPADLVRQTRDLLIFAERGGSDVKESKREEKMMELSKLIRDLKVVLYGDSESEPVRESCSQLTEEFFREDTLRWLVICLPKLNLETRKDATQIVANLQRQQVQSRLIACDYLEKNLDLMDILIAGYEDTDMALHYGTMLRECTRHQTVARYVLESEHMKKFFHYIQLPNFDIASDATSTFKVMSLFSMKYGGNTSGSPLPLQTRNSTIGLDLNGLLSLKDGAHICYAISPCTIEECAYGSRTELLTRHKSTVAEFLLKNYDWFFAEYNKKLLDSANYITKRQATKLLGDILGDRSNSDVMARYVSSKENLWILMDILKKSTKSIQIEAFHVFKLFVVNKNKHQDIVKALAGNREKLLRFFADFKPDKVDERFEADKAQVVREIVALKHINQPPIQL